MKGEESTHDVGTDIARAQLILAEKRTSLAVVRTGIAVAALPLSIVTALIAFSKYYDVTHNLPLIIPLLVTCFCLLIVAAYLLGRSVLRIRHQDQLLRKLRERDPEIKDLLE